MKLKMLLFLVAALAYNNAHLSAMDSEAQMSQLERLARNGQESRPESVGSIGPVLKMDNHYTRSSVASSLGGHTTPHMNAMFGGNIWGDETPTPENLKNQLIQSNKFLASVALFWAQTKMKFARLCNCRGNQD